MSSIQISGDTSGSVTLAVPAVAGNNTVTLPAGTGTAAVQGVSTNIVSGTAQNSTSGTSILFTGIPSWAKRITVMFNGVSTNGTSNYLVQIGAGSVTTTGYIGGINNHAGNTGSNFSTGFMFFNSLTAANTAYGIMQIDLQTANTWVEQSVMTNSASVGDMRYSAGLVALSGALDRVNITTVNGTDTFDAGSINILWE